MRIWIDCEWNSYQGELLSMGLIAEDDTPLYGMLAVPDDFKYDPWVAENVLPKLIGVRVPRKLFQEWLEQFLLRFETIHIIADWPEDIAQFCNMLIRGPGQRIQYPPLTLEVTTIDAESEMPHHALYDAKGIKKAYLAFHEAKNE